MIKKILRRKLKVKKAGLREHIEHRKKTTNPYLCERGDRVRIYKNKAGERFSVKRIMLLSLNEKPYYQIKVEGINGTNLSADANISIDSKSKTICLERIDVIGQFGGNEEKKGRCMAQVFVDEAKQFGIKYFKGERYSINITPINRKLEKYYLSLGFKKLIGWNKLGTLTMIVGENK